MSNKKRSLVIPQETMQMIGKAVRDTYKAELRAKVDVKQGGWMGSINFDLSGRAWIPVDELLALIDGGSE